MQAPDAAHLRKGYHLNMFCMSLNDAGNRAEGARGGVLDRFRKRGVRCSPRASAPVWFEPIAPTGCGRAG